MAIASHASKLFIVVSVLRGTVGEGKMMGRGEDARTPPPHEVCVLLSKMAQSRAIQ